MSEEKPPTPWQQKVAQFLFGLILLGGSVYCWHVLEMDGFLSFIVAAAGVGACSHALDLHISLW